MKSRESVASCCEGKTCASSRHSRKPAFQLQEGRVNPAQTLQEFEQRLGKKRLERLKARVLEGYSKLGVCGVVTTTLAVRSAAKTHMRRARVLEGYPELGTSGVVTTTLAVRSAAKTHMRRARVLEGYPELGTCGVVTTTSVAVPTGTGTPTLPETS